MQQQLQDSRALYPGRGARQVFCQASSVLYYSSLQSYLQEATLSDSRQTFPTSMRAFVEHISGTVWRDIYREDHLMPLPHGYTPTRRSKTRLHTGWRFHLGDLPGAERPAYDDSAWEAVNVPHTL